MGRESAREREVHFSEARQFVRLTEQAKPWWMIFAVVDIASCYAAYVLCLAVALLVTALHV